MAQRHEIEAWVNPEAWDDPAEAERVIDAIEETGSDDAAVWAAIAFPEDVDPQRETVLAAASADYDKAGAVLDTAREALYEAIRDSSRRGMSNAAIARAAGISKQMVGRIVP